MKKDFQDVLEIQKKKMDEAESKLLSISSSKSAYRPVITVNVHWWSCTILRATFRHMLQRIKQFILSQTSYTMTLFYVSGTQCDSTMTRERIRKPTADQS